MIIVLHYQIIQNQTEVLVLKLNKKGKQTSKNTYVAKIPYQKEKMFGKWTNKNK